MIKIGTKEALYGYIDIILAQLANIVVLPIVLRMVNTEEYAIWNIFVSLQAFVILFEGGFSILVARFATYAYSGADRILVSGTAEINKNVINYDLLYDVLSVSKQLYKKISLIAAGVLFCATFYIGYVARNCENIEQILIAWLIFSIGVIISLYFTFYTSFLKGIGKIKEMRIISICSNILQAILKVVFVISGLGLMGIAIAVTIVVFFKRLRIRRHVQKVFSKSEKKKYNSRKDSAVEIKNAMYANAKQLGLVVIAQYLENQGITLICSAFLPLNIISQYGLTLQILSIVSSVASTPTTTYQPILNQYVALKEQTKLRNLYSMLTVIVSITYWIGVLATITVVPQMLLIIKSKTHMLEFLPLIVMAVYQFELIMHQRSTKLISYTNTQPYVKSYVITAFVELLLAGLVLGVMKESITKYIIGLSIIELYNLIRWTRKSAEMVDSSVMMLYIIGIKECLTVANEWSKNLWKD